eukprot:scaffold2243_cov122-Cylindrotheca_fusiformis.AAC.18
MESLKRRKTSPKLRQCSIRGMAKMLRDKKKTVQNTKGTDKKLESVLSPPTDSRDLHHAARRE